MSDNDVTIIIDGQEFSRAEVERIRECHASGTPSEELAQHCDTTVDAIEYLVRKTLPEIDVDFDPPATSFVVENPSVGLGAAEIQNLRFLEWKHTVLNPIARQRLSEQGEDVQTGSYTFSSTTGSEPDTLFFQTQMGLD